MTGEVYIDKRLASDIAMLAKRIREGDKGVTCAEIDVVLDELALVDPEWEAKVMLEDAIA